MQQHHAAAVVVSGGLRVVGAVDLRFCGGKTAIGGDSTIGGGRRWLWFDVGHFSERERGVGESVME